MKEVVSQVYDSLAAKVTHGFEGHKKKKSKHKKKSKKGKDKKKAKHGEKHGGGSSERRRQQILERKKAELSQVKVYSTDKFHGHKHGKKCKCATGIRRNSCTVFCISLTLK